MKNKVLVLTFVFYILFSFTVFAQGKPTVDVKVDGSIDAGEKIKVYINVNDIESFFAGSIDFKYDTKFLKVISIEQGDLIKQNGVNRWDAINKIDSQSGMVSYGFTCTGNVNGFSGKGTFVIINAEVIKKSSFHIKSKPFLKQPDNDMNLKIMLCENNLNENDIKELEYEFKGYEFDVNKPSNNSNSSSAVDKSTSNNAQNSIDNRSSSATSIAKNSNSTNKGTSNSSGQSNIAKGKASKDMSINKNGIEKKNNKVRNIIIIISFIIILTGGVSGCFIFRRRKNSVLKDKTEKF